MKKNAPQSGMQTQRESGTPSLWSQHPPSNHRPALASVVFLWVYASAFGYHAMDFTCQVAGVRGAGFRVSCCEVCIWGS